MSNKVAGSKAANSASKVPHSNSTSASSKASTGSTHSQVAPTKRDFS